MYSVVIVDDEKGIVEGLSMLVNREFPTCNVVGHAYDGTDGYDLCMNLKPDIVISDIRMLRCDGLEMIERLKADGCKARFIILSGYSEFEYARKGIRLGIKSYLNKPVEEDELHECVNRLIQDLERERTELKRMESYEWQIRRSVDTLKEFVIKELMEGASAHNQETMDLLAMVDFPFGAAEYKCAIFDANQKQIEKTVYESIQIAIHEQFSDAVEIFVFKYSSTHVGLLAVLDHHRFEPGFVSRINEVRERLKDHENVSFTVGIGQTCASWEKISQSFDEAKQALSYKWMMSHAPVIDFQQLHVRPKDAPAVITERDLKRLEESIQMADRELCMQLVRCIFSNIESTQYPFSWPELQMMCFNLVLTGIRTVSPSRFYSYELAEAEIVPIDGISGYQTLKELKGWVESSLQKMIDLHSTEYVSNKQHVIEEIKKYVADHYNQNISLTDLSARFYINPQYLSQLFHEKTGQTYLNYLMQLRVNHAKELLDKTDLKIYEICEAVGYTDTTHFSRLFDKFVGCKPSMYRKKKMNAIT